jgi:Cdc6-like AAA superfamily ATPase
MQLFGVGAGAGSSRRRYSTIIVLDEIDMLMTKDQAVSKRNRQQCWHGWPGPLDSRISLLLCDTDAAGVH